ncbi:MAG: hypothetical protein ACRDM8_05895 [Gaiellaceae bacterium]
MALILITAGITGLLVPIVKSLMDWRHFRRQKDYEAELTRQTAVLDAQVKLLEDVSSVLWEYVLSLIEVSYYKTNGDKERFNQALKSYQDAAGTRFGQMQAEFSKARRLVSPERWLELQGLYGEFLRLDMRVMQLRSTDHGWHEQHNAAFGVQGRISEALASLAAEMGLIGPRARPSVTPPSPSARTPEETAAAHAEMDRIMAKGKAVLAAKAAATDAPADADAD